MPSTLRVSLSVFLSYLLVALTCVPVSTRARTRLKPKTRTAIQQSLARHRESELLVRFRGGISERDKETVIATHGALKKKDLQGVSGVEKLEILGGRDVRRVALEMLLNPQVEFAEPNYLIAKDDVVPNDPHFQQQWALRNTGQNGGQVGSDVNANGAWTITTGSKSTVIAVFAQTGKDLYDYRSEEHTSELQSQ